ncbi:hypothetical protein M407DRAFT_240571, partial [Tulasnella calospora MUT 4182]
RLSGQHEYTSTLNSQLIHHNRIRYHLVAIMNTASWWDCFYVRDWLRGVSLTVVARKKI